MEKSLIITKAPGKVLIAGGYGVLEENNFGLTLALNSYFYCVCTKYIPGAENQQFTNIFVNSYQIQQSWQYIFNNQTNQLKQVNNKINVFVQNAILWTLKYCKNVNKAGNINLQIVFTRNFISNNDALDLNSQFPIYKKGYNKTGLGSSACVIVSIVKCLVQIFINKQQQKIQDIKKIINLISQIANLQAQKKIGSNFDISTAVYGTHLYKNILPYKISKIIHNNVQIFQQLLKIDPQVTQITKPQLEYYSYIIDINKGADTRVMVKSFMSQLKKCTKQIQQEFYKSSKEITLNLFQAIKKGQIQKCKQINKVHRKLQQKYSQITGVPVEPNDLSSLINQIMNIEGSIYGICPGSGGYDAIFVLAVTNIKQQLKSKVGTHSVRQVEIQFDTNLVVTEAQRHKILQVIKDNAER